MIFTSALGTNTLSSWGLKWVWLLEPKFGMSLGHNHELLSVYLTYSTRLRELSGVGWSGGVLD